MSERRMWLVALGMLAVVGGAAWAQTKAPKVVKRAQPPKFSGRDNTFYPDAFVDGLVGERPANFGAPPTAVAGSPAGGAPATSSAPSSAAGGGTWSGLISAGTIEDEIKAMKTVIDAEITTPSDFAGKGYKAARRDFSVVAMLFGIIGEYDGDVRFKSEGAAARDVFGRTAANAKVGTTQVFQEAKLRKQELQDVVGGSGPFNGKPADAKPVWPQVCDRAPLMQYIEQIWEPRLKPALSDKAAFTAASDKVLHDAEMFAAIGDVLAKDGMADADSDEYKALCNRLRDAAHEIAEGVKSKNYEQASKAGADIGKTCTECHESYRS